MVMRFDRRLKDIQGALNILVIIIVAVLMISSLTVVISLYQSDSPGETSTSDVVAAGMTISVDYTGKFLDGRIFDTTSYDIASNDALYPKSLSFTLQSESSYDALSFVVGSGDLITGFDDAVVGMRVGETKTVTLTPDEAYGDLDESLLTTFDLVQTIPLTQTLTATEFADYYGETPVAGSSVVDPVYGWDVTVYSYNVNADAVIIYNYPTLNAEYHIYGEEEDDQGWDVLVTYIDSTSNVVVIEHQLTDSDSDYVEGIDGDGETFFIIDVDTDAGTAVMNYNSETVGKTLVFTITIVSIDDE